MTVATPASSSSRGGSSPGTVLASSVLPEPGGPTMTMQWPPASASSRARLASSWPRTSARSGPGSAPAATRANPRSGLARPRRRRRAPPAAAWYASCRAGSRAAALRPRPAWQPPTRRCRRPAGLPPGHPTAPRPASPSAAPGPRPSAAAPARAQLAPERQLAEDGPAAVRFHLLRSDQYPQGDREIQRGAALAHLRRGEVDGDPSRWVLVAAVPDGARTRSLASCRAVSASPTIVNPGRPGATSTSTRIGRPSRPWSVADRREASTRPSYALRLTRALSANSRGPSGRL